MRENQNNKRKKGAINMQAKRKQENVRSKMKRKKKMQAKRTEIVKAKRPNECSKPKIKNLNTKRCVRMGTDM